MTRIELLTGRLLMRAWRDSDIEPFAALNSDPQVMRWFPAAVSKAATEQMVARLDEVHARLGFTLWAVEVLESERGPADFVDFVGLIEASFDPPFPHALPCVEVGWRLAAPWWGLGIATEAAQAALQHGFSAAALTEIVSFTVPPNLQSQRVMQKLGMRYDGVFTHPRAQPTNWWAPHVLYRIAVQDQRGDVGYRPDERVDGPLR